MTELNCPSCKSDKVDLIGKIPATDIFAGRVLPSLINGNSLYSCGQCKLSFRFPRMKKEDMDSLYRAGTEDNWGGDSGNRRVDWEIGSAWISSLGADRKVLDVGCFRGGFLKSLKGEGEGDISGIEIHENAAEQARRSGIRIIGNDFDAIEKTSDRFDVVTAFDVIEHVDDPKVFLAQLARVTTPNGKIVISTGNTMSSSWMLMGSRYWYCTIAEHISFINPEWCRLVAEEYELKVEKIEFFSHEAPFKLIALRKMGELAANLLYKFVPSAFHLLRKSGRGAKDVKKHPELLDSPPQWLSAKDHMIVCFGKRNL